MLRNVMRSTCFRTVEPILHPLINTRELAAIAVEFWHTLAYQLHNGFLAQLRGRPDERQPIPVPLTHWNKEDITNCIRFCAFAWAVKFEVHDNCTGVVFFRHTGSFRLSTCHGCGELQAFGVRVSKAAAPLIRAHLIAQDDNVPIRAQECSVCLFSVAGCARWCTSRTRNGRNTVITICSRTTSHHCLRNVLSTLPVVR